MTFSDPFFWGSLHFSQSVSRASWMWAEKRMKTCKIEVKYIATAAGASQTVHCHTAPLCKASCLVKTSRDNYKFSKLKYCLGIILNTITHTHVKTKVQPTVNLKDWSRVNCYRACKGSVNVCTLGIRFVSGMKEKGFATNYLYQNSLILRYNKLSLTVYISTFRITLTPLSSGCTSLHYSLPFHQVLIHVWELG